MNYTNDWFELTAKKSWDKLFETFRPTKCLEVGSFEGKSLCYLIDKLDRAELYAVDTWEGGHDLGHVNMSEVEGRFKQNIGEALSVEGKKITLKVHRGLSHLVLAAFLAEGHEGSFDFIYIDGSHLATDVLLDATLSFKLLQKGGVLIFDDYSWKENHNPLHSPKLAIDSFVNTNFDHLEILDTQISQLHLRKI